jgi:ketosteroid isomerase-like protein
MLSESATAYFRAHYTRKDAALSDAEGHNEALKPGSTATPLSTLIWAVVSGDMATVEAQLADDIEWDQMPYNQKLKGKKEVMPWLKAGATSEKMPEVINNVMAENWGVFEYWNIGTATLELIEFGKKQGWPFPKEPNSLIGQKYRVAQCFVYHLDSNGQINRMRQYLDAGSVWAQFK